MQKPNPKNMVKIGDLRKIVEKLRYRQEELGSMLDGVSEVDSDTKKLFIERDSNEGKIGKYSAILKKHDAKYPSQDAISKIIRIGKAIKKEF